MLSISELKYRAAINFCSQATTVVHSKPESCPSCGCQRFWQLELKMHDRLLGREGRFRCDKCHQRTLFIHQKDDSELAQAGLELNIPEDATDQKKAHLYHYFAAKYALGKEGVEKNLPIAVLLFTKAANLGYPPSQYHLAMFFARGLGTEKDEGTANYWLKRSADGGYKRAISKLDEGL